MTLKHHFRLTASEIAMGRVMRAPDHSAADEFDAAFAQFGKDEPPAGAGEGKGEGDGTGSAGAAAAGDEPGGAAGGTGDGSGASAGEASAAAGDDKGGAAAEGGDKEPAAGDEGGAAAADDKSADSAAQAGESDDDVLKRLAKAVKNVATEEKPAAAVTAEEPEEQPLFSAEELGKIEHFRKEWPEVAEAFDLQARALAQSVLKYAFEQIGGVVNPMRETLDILATRTHYGDLKEKVGEYTAAERDQIVTWVKEQPAYLQKAMLSVIEEGTAEEVADLVGRYREATGKQPAGAQGEGGTPPGGDVELSEPAKQAAAALAPVSTKRSAVQAPDDKSDFGAAFAKFADELG